MPCGLPPGPCVPLERVCRDTHPVSSCAHNMYVCCHYAGQRRRIHGGSEQTKQISQDAERSQCMSVRMR
eukprot:6778022-Heterocapsa_arctica.AAC.1